MKWKKVRRFGNYYQTEYKLSTFEIFIKEDEYHLFIIKPGFRTLGIYHSLKEVKSYLDSTDVFLD